jgi:hypothetical protein
MHYAEAADEVSPSNVAERMCCRMKAHSQVDCLVYATTLVFWSEYSGTSSRHGTAALVVLAPFVSMASKHITV